MNKDHAKPTDVALMLDDEIISALDRGRVGERLSRRSYARAIVARHLRENGHLPAHTQVTGDAR